MSCRFRADPGGVFQGARPFLIWSFKRKGYHAGSGGTLKVELQTDDGTPVHRPSGQVLATNVRRMALMATSDQFYPQMTFDRAPVLVPGAAKWCLGGMHTLNGVQVGPQEWWAGVDGRHTVWKRH